MCVKIKANILFRAAACGEMMIMHASANVWWKKQIKIQDSLKTCILKKQSIHAHVLQNLYDLLSYLKHKLRYL